METPQNAHFPDSERWHAVLERCQRLLEPFLRVVKDSTPIPQRLLRAGVKRKRSPSQRHEVDLQSAMQPHPAFPERTPLLVADQVRSGIEGRDRIDAAGVLVRICREEDEVDVAAQARLVIRVGTDERQG